MFTRILVPTDFSPPSEAALGYARMLAGTFGGTLHLLHVLDNLFLRAVVTDPRDAETTALGQVYKRLTDEDRRRFGAIAAVERSDVPADEIVSYARTRKVDLIVMGTHGRTGMAHLLVGSVTEQVVRHAPCPVLSLHRAPRGAGGYVGSRRILVPTDFSGSSDAALASARRVAAEFGASLHLLHVVQDPMVDESGGEAVYLADSPATRTGRLNDAQRRLSCRITAEDRGRFRATTEVQFGDPAQVIPVYADDNDFDLIMMGTHGRTGLEHLLVGSVAEAVVRTAPCPVMTMRESSASVEGLHDRQAVTTASATVHPSR